MRFTFKTKRSSRTFGQSRRLGSPRIDRQKLLLFDTGTRTWRALDADRIDNASWSRDGAYIYYDTEDGPHALRRVRISDGRVDELVNMSDYPNLAYWWSGIALDNSPIILRNLGSVQIYALDLEFR